MFTTTTNKEHTFNYIYPLGRILSSVAWAIRSSYKSSTDATPAQLVSGRDMLFIISNLINWKVLALSKQKSVDKANLCENCNRVDYDYQIEQ